MRYIDVEQLYTDAKVQALLCKNCPIAYRQQQDVNLDNNWLFVHVVPNLRAAYPNDTAFCKVMIHVLLGACLDPIAKNNVP
jgi:hypothetical protein